MFAFASKVFQKSKFVQYLIDISPGIGQTGLLSIPFH